VARTTAEKQSRDSGEPAAPEPDEDAASAEADRAPEARESAEPPDEPPETSPDEPGEAQEPPSGESAAERAGTEQADAEERPSGEASAGQGDSGEGTAGDASDEPAGRRRADPLLLVATVLVVAAAACAAYFGWSWYGAAHDESLAYSRDRDTVLRAAEQGVQNLNTLDYRKVDQGLASWEDSSTGDLRRQLAEGRAQFAAQVRLARTVTTARILDGAVTELDDHAGKAGAIVAVQITVTPPNGAPTTKQSRMRAQLTRTPSGWKLSALGQAPVGTTAG
jgi:Mce-associated membrane protein